MINVLVTGVGAVIGYGVVRALRKTEWKVRIVGADIYPDAVGQIWCDEFARARPTADDHYLDWLTETISRYRIDLVIPTIEPDVLRLSQERDRLLASHCKFALNNPHLIDISTDKLAMDRELLRLDEKTRIASLTTSEFEEIADLVGVPFVIKPRRSSASKGLVRITDKAQFEPYANRMGSEYIAQALVGSDDEEYTVAVFGDGEGNVDAAISLRRRLGPDGATSKAWSGQYPGLDAVVSRLCSSFRPLGPTNFQFRKTGADWKLLEINPRISSATSIRASFGYNEAAMCVQYFVSGERPKQPELRWGFAARYMEDVIVYDRDHF